MQIKVMRKPNSLAINVVAVCGVLMCFLVSFSSPNMSEVNIVTLNVNGVREMRKRAEI